MRQSLRKYAAIAGFLLCAVHIMMPDARSGHNFPDQNREKEGIMILLSIQGPSLIGLRNSINFLNEQGQGTTYWDIPNIPELNGITVYAAFVVLDHTLPVPFASISNAVPITITQ